ncbi:hypothetical protein OG21DRAFT_1490134 [Imleria badia]|nr:hypothetical protein OG21DRAFT_1490134 [Imleria badia]
MAIGAFKVPSSPRVSHFTTPLLSRTQHPLKLSTSFTFSSPSISSRPGDYIGAKESVTTSDSEDDSEGDEARFLLRIMRAQRHARQLEQNVISAQLAENTAIGDLFKFRAEQVQKKLNATEYDLGYLRNEIRKSGISLVDLPSAHKWRRLSNENKAGSLESVNQTPSPSASSHPDASGSKNRHLSPPVAFPSVGRNQTPAEHDVPLPVSDSPMPCRQLTGSSGLRPFLSTNAPEAAPRVPMTHLANTGTAFPNDLCLKFVEHALPGWEIENLVRASEDGSLKRETIILLLIHPGFEMLAGLLTNSPLQSTILSYIVDGIKGFEHEHPSKEPYFLLTIIRILHIFHQVLKI